jgi:cell division protein FtsQ
MDGGGRLAQPLKRPKRPAAAGKARKRQGAGGTSAARSAAGLLVSAPIRFGHWLERLSRRMIHPPRGTGIACSVLLVLAAIGYGTVRGGHLQTFLAGLADTRDALANAAGFRVQSLAISGRKQMTEGEVLAAAGITDRTSLLFLDVTAAKAALELTPRIAHATVRKMYPGELHITVEEREPFAFWQNAGKVSVIATDGAVLAPYDSRWGTSLPLVVGPGAAPKARDLMAVLDRFPAVREQMRAAVLVAERRWNLRLKNGLDIRLPETEVAEALERLAVLDAEKKLLTRDITSVDLRLPDRVSVRLSDEAAQARENALKEKKAKKKGGDA